MTEQDTTTGSARRQWPEHTPTELERELDRLSLTQALRDFEVANARVIDLTQRLIAARSDLVAVRQDLDALRQTHEELRLTHEQMRRSRAFRLANRIRAIRNLL
ncbi:MAG: hypothetical protein LC799_20360 [Actinobacteria bacterium]|nr:hypothetical protein [Actinomycetota bacterium]